MILQPKQDFCPQKVLYLRDSNNNNFITKSKKNTLRFFLPQLDHIVMEVLLQAMMWSRVVKDKQSEARGFLSWKRIWSLLVESHVNAMTQMTNPFFGGERRTKGRRFLWVWVEERSEGKYSEWRGGTTQCQRDSPLYISIPGAVKKLNVCVKNYSKEESSILNLKL